MASACRHPSLIFSVECAAQIAFTFCLARESEKGEEACSAASQSFNRKEERGLFDVLDRACFSLALAPSHRHDGMGSFEADKCPGRCGLINALPVGRTHGRRRAANPIPSSPTTPRPRERAVCSSFPRRAKMHLGLVPPPQSSSPRSLLPFGSSSVAKLRAQSWPNEVTCTGCAVQYVRLHHESKCSHALDYLIGYHSAR